MYCVHSSTTAVLAGRRRAAPRPVGPGPEVMIARHPVAVPRCGMRRLAARANALLMVGAAGAARLQQRCQCSATTSEPRQRGWPGLPASTPPALRAALEDDGRELCALPIDPACVTTLGGPAEFYERLREAAAGAENRILLASLYIGTGEKEQALLDAVAAACDRTPSLQATLLVDALRTQRVERSGVSSLDRIVERCGRHIPTARQLSVAGPGRGLNVFLYHTHMLGKIGKRVLPPRWNEGISLQHCKVYLFDDTVILSGANLSDTYFTDRDDRYVVFTDCAPLADYVHELFASERGLPAACYTVHTKHEPTVGPSRRSTAYELVQPAIGHDPVTDGRQFGTATERHLRAFLAQQRQRGLEKATQLEHAQSSGDAECCTWVVPALQFATHGIAQDEPLLAEIVSQLGTGSANGHDASGSLVLSSAYLNLTSSQFSYSPLAKALASPGCSADVTLVLASDESHGFSGATGLSAYIPQGYALLRSRLQGYLERAREGRLTEVRLHRRLVDGKHWSFHCKALWYTDPGAATASADGSNILNQSRLSQDRTGAQVPHLSCAGSPAGPGLTVVGSSNFGRRSMARDLEAQFWLVRHTHMLVGRARLPFLLVVTARSSWRGAGDRRCQPAHAAEARARADTNANRGPSRGGRKATMLAGAIAHVLLLALFMKPIQPWCLLTPPAGPSPQVAWPCAAFCNARDRAR